MYQHQDKFLLYDFKNDEDLSYYRWTLDTSEDFKFIETVYSELYKEGSIVSTEEVLGPAQDSARNLPVECACKSEKILNSCVSLGEVGGEL